MLFLFMGRTEDKDTGKEEIIEKCWLFFACSKSEEHKIHTFTQI